MLILFTSPFRGQHIPFLDCLHLEKDLPHTKLPLYIFSPFLKLSLQCSHKMSFFFPCDSLQTSVILIEGTEDSGKKN